MIKRTDLALEARETYGSKIKGVSYSEKTRSDAKISRLTVKTEQAAKELGKPMGTYITIDVPNFTDNSGNLEEHAVVISKEIQDIIPKQGLVLVAGLGNKEITPDNLGPKAVACVLATRHITEELKRSSSILSSLRGVATTSPGVVGKTGIETGEMLYSIVSRVKPAAVIVIDALASMRLKRLGRTVQISDTGIAPGSGVGNERPKINQETMGVPVIAIGVPTVVDAMTLTSDLLKEQHAGRNDISLEASSMMVTPREVDLLIGRSAKLVALSINLALQKKLDVNDILALMS